MKSSLLDHFDKVLQRTGVPDFAWPWIAGVLSASVMLYWRLRFLYSQGSLREMLSVSFGYSPPIVERVKMDFIVLALLIVLNLMLLIPGLQAARKYRSAAGKYHYLFMAIFIVMVLVAAIAQPLWIHRIFERSTTHIEELGRIYPFLDLWIGTNLVFLVLASACHLNNMRLPRPGPGVGAFIGSIFFVLRMGHWWKGWQISLAIMLLSFLCLGLEWRTSPADSNCANGLVEPGTQL
jgi:hypothetical protein